MTGVTMVDEGDAVRFVLPDWVTAEQREAMKVQADAFWAERVKQLMPTPHTSWCQGHSNTDAELCARPAVVIDKGDWIAVHTVRYADEGDANGEIGISVGEEFPSAYLNHAQATRLAAVLLEEVAASKAAPVEVER